MCFIFFKKKNEGLEIESAVNAGGLRTKMIYMVFLLIGQKLA